jgi:hypothetical protein
MSNGRLSSRRRRRRRDLELMRITVDRPWLCRFLGSFNWLTRTCSLVPLPNRVLRNDDQLSSSCRKDLDKWRWLRSVLGQINNDVNSSLCWSNRLVSIGRASWSWWRWRRSMSHDSFSLFAIRHRHTSAKFEACWNTSLEIYELYVLALMIKSTSILVDSGLWLIWNDVIGVWIAPAS